jgi:hypothetical protein
MREERLRYMKLRADGEVSHQFDHPHFDDLDHDEVLLRIVGRRNEQGAFKPVAVDIIG